MTPAIAQSNWRGRRIVVTGGAGFIGSTLAFALANAGASVVAFDNFDPDGGSNPANLEGAPTNLSIVEGDTRDPVVVRKIVCGADVLFNIAGLSSHQGSMDDPATDLDVNVKAQLVILQACRDLAPDIRVVLASTRQLYGKARYLPVDEKHPVDPTDVNGINKLAAEHYHRLFNRVYDVRSNIARLTNVYGPRMRIKDAKQMFLGFWIGQALCGNKYEVWGGEQRRDFSYVDDTVSALIAMADAEPFGQTFNVGGAPPVSLKDLADLVAAQSGSRGYVVREMPKERQLIDIGDFFADDDLLRKATGWTSETALEVGLRATIDYFRRRLPQYL